MISYSKLLLMKEAPPANDGRAARCGSPEAITPAVELHEAAPPVREEKVAAYGWIFGMIISDGTHREEENKAHERNIKNL